MRDCPLFVLSMTGSSSVGSSCAMSRALDCTAVFQSTPQVGGEFQFSRRSLSVTRKMEKRNRLTGDESKKALPWTHTRDFGRGAYFVVEGGGIETHTELNLARV